MPAQTVNARSARKPDPMACMWKANAVAGAAIAKDSTAPKHSKTASIVMANQYITPTEAPTTGPSAREIMWYGPPRLTRPPEEAMELMDAVVHNAAPNDMATTTSVCHTPASPTMLKNRRKINTPHMFSHVGTKTPLKAPFFLLAWCLAPARFSWALFLFCSNMSLTRKLGPEVSSPETVAQTMSAAVPASGASSRPPPGPSPVALEPVGATRGSMAVMLGSRGPERRCRPQAASHAIAQK
mmetsp:Transcript_88408/g.270592  ORF Transcript_88408/g.270592 Transcript_88408/m.270592 type:complete len:241 (+) Transcript_88408:2027-2749(+)